jgi:hypothetical protein
MERLKSAEAAVEEVNRLVRAQEAEITRMRLAGLNVSRARHCLVPRTTGLGLGRCRKIYADISSGTSNDKRCSASSKASQPLAVNR